jgi:threonine synthase
MRFSSTAGLSPSVDLAEALRRGLAAAGGLFVPDALPPLPRSFFDELPGKSLHESAGAAIVHLLGDSLPAAVLRSVVEDALDFPVPLVRLGGRVHVLELFHGPTLAFKDVGARFLARLLAETRGGELTVLVATSGDTGGAVAQAFFGVEGTRVAVLYPRGKVSALQERQFTTLGGNVRAFAVDGVFDDCQRLVKAAFADRDLGRRLGLTSANSINVGRLLPQILYYFHAAAQLEGYRAAAGPPLLFSTPSGNFGNLTAGLMARALGLDSRFIAATNVNDVVPEYLRTSIYRPRPSVPTISNAMDVGDPSNFVRIRHLYRDAPERLHDHLVGRSYDDGETAAAIREVDRERGYLMDPHTAVGYLALRDVLPERSPETVGIVLSTAHPAKFREVVEPVIGREIELPPQLASRLGHPVLSEELGNDVEELKARLLDWEPAG